MSLAEQSLTWCTSALLALLVFLLFLPDSTITSTIISFVTSFISGYIIWVLVVWLPEKKRMSVLRNNMQIKYQFFREAIARILFIASGQQGYKDTLCDYKEIRRAFPVEKWYPVLNGLQENEHLLNDIKVEFTIFQSELSFFINNINFDDKQVCEKLRRLSEHVYRLNNDSVYQGDPVKYWGNFLWRVMARWSDIDGELDYDWIEDAINGRDRRRHKKQSDQGRE